MAVSFTSCEDEPDPQENCANGVQDADEDGVDCGGPCTACPVAATTDILTATIDGNAWESVSIVATVSASGRVVITATGADNSEVLVKSDLHTTTGMPSSRSIQYIPTAGGQIIYNSLTDDQDIIVNYTKFDETARLLSGTFSGEPVYFNIETLTNEPISVSGSFTDVSY